MSCVLYGIAGAIVFSLGCGVVLMILGGVLDIYSEDWRRSRGD